MNSNARATARGVAAASLGLPWFAATIARLGYPDRQVNEVSDDLVSDLVAHGDPDVLPAFRR